VALPDVLETSADEGTAFQSNELNRSDPRFQALMQKYRNDVESPP